MAFRRERFEVYDQIGLGRNLAIERGTIASRVGLIEGGEIRGEMNLGNFGKDMSQYPYMLMLEQSKNEELLYDFIRSHNRDVLWKTELEKFAQNESGVTHKSRLRRANRKRSGKFLVGCDGARSPVRHGLGLEFEGSTFERLVLRCRCARRLGIPARRAARLSRARCVRRVFSDAGRESLSHRRHLSRKQEPSDGEVLYEEIEREVKEQVKLSLEISDVRWFSLYKVHSRRVKSFRKGGVFSPAIRRTFTAPRAHRA